MDAMGIIFSNVHDEDLRELTESRAFASVPYGGRYRLIDFVLSNMVNSGISNVGVIVKHRYLSLMDHVGSGKEWDLDRKIGGLFIFPPYARMSDAGIYRGRLEALAGVKTYLRRSLAKYVVLADCNIVCNMDLTDIVRSHVDRKADFTVVYHRSSENEGTQGLRICCKFDNDERLTDIAVNPASRGDQNTSLDIFVVDREFLISIVEEASSRGQYSLSRDFLQKNYQKYRMFGYEFDGYFARIDSVKRFFSANMELLEADVRRALFHRNGDIYTKVRDEVPAFYGKGAQARKSLIADGCVIEGEVENSILFRGVRVGKGAKISNSIVMQGTAIGERASLLNVVTDKDVVVKPGRLLSGSESYPMVVRKGSTV